MSSNLYIRSAYTLLSSLCSINNIVELAKRYGYNSLALVDKNVLAGAPTFKNACLKNNIQAIYGMEIDLRVMDNIYPVILYAKNDNGFKNLMKLSSEININDLNDIDIELLNKYKQENFICLYSNNMPLLEYRDYNEGFLKQKELFEDYIVALIDHDNASNRINDEKLKPYLKENNIMSIALSRTFYYTNDDIEAFGILNCIKDKTIYDKSKLSSIQGRYLLKPNEFDDMYEHDDLINNDLLASMCHVELDYQTSLPLYKNKYDVSSKDYLVSLCKQGLNKRLKGNVSSVYKKRLDYELSVILQMQFEDYFLIVYDFILYAKKNNIMVGPGRGSAAGSLVSYCLGITDIDPIENGLIFERFLNPERVTMPDIDTDFPDDKRDEVIKYVREKYGEDKVAHILTYGTLKAKQAIRDVCRCFNYPTYEIDSISKLISNDPKMTLEIAYNTLPNFAMKINSDQKYQRVFNIAKKIEFIPRHYSTHAAGIIISKDNLTDVIPITKVEQDLYSSQYTMEYLEQYGLIKMDFLSLKNLSIIAEIVKDIQTKHDFDIRNIPLDDEKTLELIRNVNVLGVFQLESDGMRNLLGQIKPRSFADIGMTIALFRPGPMENIPIFLANRENPNKIEYLHPDLKDILEETYGIIVYQEQIINIARKLAGFTYGKADILRSAMSKKKLKELETLHPDFINGCINNGYDLQLAEKIYELIMKFANYGFNKSHSVAYATVAYQLAYLKANYPLYFYKALLNGTISSQSKTYDYIRECLAIKQKVKGISLNESEATYIIKDDSIVMPFTLCKELASISANKIVEIRKNGLFNDYIDAVTRLTLNGIDKNVIENLIYVGAFDEFKYSRHTMIENLNNVIMYANTKKGGLTLSNEFNDYPDIKEYNDDNMVLAENEKRVLGFYFSFNPIASIKQKNNITTNSLHLISNTMGKTNGFGLIQRVKQHRTKKGDMMAFVDIVDDTGSLSLVVMPDLYLRFFNEIIRGRYIEFEGMIEKQGSCLVKKIRMI